MLLMAASMLVSGFQLPVLGWFTQIGAVAAAMSGFFGVAAEPATACAATLLAVTFLSIAPVGLIWALEHVSLRKVAAESEHAEETLAVDEPAARDTMNKIPFGCSIHPATFSKRSSWSRWDFPATGWQKNCMSPRHG